MIAKITELTIWILALVVVGSIAVYALKRLFSSGGSVAKDFEVKLSHAEKLEADIKKLKEESTRDTADFQAALRKHRARFGGGTNNSPTDTPPSAG